MQPALQSRKQRINCTAAVAIQAATPPLRPLTSLHSDRVKTGPPLLAVVRRQCARARTAHTSRIGRVPRSWVNVKRARLPLGASLCAVLSSGVVWCAHVLSHRCWLEFSRLGEFAGTYHRMAGDGCRGRCQCSSARRRPARGRRLYTCRCRAHADCRLHPRRS